MNTGAILARINFGLMVASGASLAIVRRVAGWEGARFASARCAGGRRDSRDIGGEASPDTRKVLESGVNPMAGKSTANATRHGGLENMLGLALGAPEFQRR